MKKKKILKFLLSYTTIIVLSSYLGIFSYLLQTNTIKPKNDVIDNPYEKDISGKRDLDVSLISSDIEYRKELNDEVAHMRQEEFTNDIDESYQKYESNNVDYVSGEVIVRYDGDTTEFVRDNQHY